MPLAAGRHCAVDQELGRDGIEDPPLVGSLLVAPLALVPRSLLVVLHDVAGPDWAQIGVLAGVAPGPALAEQVPALVELDFDLVQPGPFFVRQALVRRVLRSSWCSSATSLSMCSTISASFIWSSYPRLCPFVTAATWSVPGIMPHLAGLFHCAMNQTLSHSPDLLGLYLDEAGSFPLLTKADEMRLGQIIQEGQAAQATLASEREADRQAAP